MSGWRDADGRTAAERRRAQSGKDRERLLATARHRPLTLLKGLAGFVFIVILVIALISWMG